MGEPVSGAEKCDHVVGVWDLPAAMHYCESELATLIREVYRRKLRRRDVPADAGLVEEHLRQVAIIRCEWCPDCGERILWGPIVLEALAKVREAGEK